MLKHGWVILDKPLNMTSTQAVGRIKRFLKTKKAGHAGTLDPLATGMLPIAIGEATKTIPYVVEGLKKYAFRVGWGVQTTTDDLEGAVLLSSEKRPNTEQIEANLKKWVGVVMQMPPQFSALKVNGERAYDLARSGQEVVLKTREVHIQSLTLIAHEGDYADFEMVCGKGTYVRSLARDLGQELGCFGHVQILRRLFVAPFDEKMMVPLALIEEIVHKGDETALYENVLRPVSTPLDDIPAVAVDRTEMARLQNGQPLFAPNTASFAQGDVVRLMNDNSFIGLGEVLDGSIHPRRMFNFAKA